VDIVQQQQLKHKAGNEYNSADKVKKIAIESLICNVTGVLLLLIFYTIEFRHEFFCKQTAFSNSNINFSFKTKNQYQ
jgi:hypothetical protein